MRSQKLSQKIGYVITMGLFDRIKAASTAFRFPAGITHRGGSFLSMAPRTFPYEQTDPLGDSAVVNVLAWIQRNFIQAEFEVCIDSDGNKQDVANHPLTALLNVRPNSGYEASQLWAGTLLSYHLDGNAYWIKSRNARGFGVPTEIWYEPHWAIKPHWPEDGSTFIDYYERRINGTIERIPVENVVHFRNSLNPANTRYGLAPLKAALLQVFTDTEVSLWVAALCRNMAIPGVIVSPTEPIGMTLEKAEQIKQTWKRKFGGDNRGEPLILDFQADIKTLGYDPKTMDFAAITNLAESRIAGAMGVPAIVAGLSAGLDSSTYNNLANLKKSAFEECLIPTWQQFERTISSQLLPDFERNGSLNRYACFDTSDVRALQENQSEKEQRAIAAWQAGITTLNETRAQFGYAPDPSGDYYLISNSYSSTTTANQMSRAEAETSSVQAVVPPQLMGTSENAPTKSLLALTAHSVKSIEWNGLTLRRQPTDLEARMLKALDDTYQQGRVTMEGKLFSLRQKYITEIIDELDGIDPSEYYQATVTVSDSDRSAIAMILSAIFMRGAKLILDELRNQGVNVSTVSARPKEATVNTLAGAIVSRVANDVQARATGAAISATLLGQNVPSMVAQSMRDGSTAYISRAANEATNWAIGEGRAEEMRAQSDQFEYLVYSAVLDNSTCTPCGEMDGNSYGVNDAPSIPNPNCEGGAQCRCVLIPVVASGI